MNHDFLLSQDKTMLSVIATPFVVRKNKILDSLPFIKEGMISVYKDGSNNDNHKT